MEFTRRMQGDAAAAERVEGLQVVTAMRFPSTFQPEAGQDARQATLESWGVQFTSSLEQALAPADGILLSLNDATQHLEFFKRIVALGKPIFIDKPLAGSLADAQAICALAESKSAQVWSSSSLRFDPALIEASRQLPAPEACQLMAPLRKAPSGSSILWYGVHTIEMMTRLMGLGAQAVRTWQNGRGIVVLVTYGEGRQALAELDWTLQFYAGALRSKDKLAQFATARGEAIYSPLVKQLAVFFCDKQIPVPLRESVEIQAIMDALERSLESGQEEPLRA